MHDRTINVRNTSDFPSLNGQHTTVLPCARTRKQNQSVNTQDLNSFPALGQEPASQPKPLKPNNNIRMAAMLKKPVEPPKPDRNNEGAGPSISRLPNQARDFPSLDGNQHQAKVNEVTRAASSTANSGSSWVSKAKTTNENGQDLKKKAKKELAAIKKKVAEAPKVPGPSDFPNLNKKLEPSKSNLAKLGNKKKMDIAKKNITPVENHNNDNSTSNSNQNGKKNGVQTTAENNSKKATENKSIDNNKENNKPKPKPIDVQCNGMGELLKTTKTAVNNNNTVKVGAEPKKELSKKKETVPAVLQKPDETVADANNLKDKKKRKKNENKEFIQQVLTTATSAKQTNSERLQSNHSKLNMPKVPPGFENTFHHSATTVRAPPGLMTTVSSSSNQRHQTQIAVKAPPGLSLNNNINNNGKQFEYLHPIGSAVRNRVLINNLMVALIPARDERFDTFEKFKEMSTLFRKHVITAYDFYSYCVEALCPNSFEQVFQELVLLLPDIQKQQV